MELLLILSAMLSAVTGAFSGVGGPEARLHQAEASIGTQIAVRAVEKQVAEARPARPAAAPPSTEVPPLPAFAIAPAAPLYVDRPLE